MTQKTVCWMLRRQSVMWAFLRKSQGTKRSPSKLLTSFANSFLLRKMTKIKETNDAATNMFMTHYQDWYDLNYNLNKLELGWSSNNELIYIVFQKYLLMAKRFRMTLEYFLSWLMLSTDVWTRVKDIWQNVCKAMFVLAMSKILSVADIWWCLNAAQFANITSLRRCPQRSKTTKYKKH